MKVSGRRDMPTAAKLVGALVFGIWGLYIAILATPLFFDGIPPVSFLPASILIGIYLGWAYMGRRAGLGYIAAIGHAATAVAAFSFLSLFVIGFSIMIHRAMRLQYDGPMEGFVSIFGIMISEGPRFADVTLIANMAVGALICGLITEFVGKRYS